MEQEDRENCKQELGQKNKSIYVKGGEVEKKLQFHRIDHSSKIESWESFFLS